MDQNFVNPPNNILHFLSAPIALNTNKSNTPFDGRSFQAIRP